MTCYCCPAQNSLLLSYHQFPQEGNNHSLVTRLNGESRLYIYPMHQLMFVLHTAQVSHGHCSAELHCYYGIENKG